MKNIILIISTLLLFTSCNSIKRNQRFLAQGNYDQAIELSLRKLERDPQGKNSAIHISLLEQAFAQVVVEDKRRIAFLEQENNPSNSREIYYLYCDLDKRQLMLRPIQSVVKASLIFENYNTKIIRSKNNFANYLNTEGNRLLNTKNIFDAREAHTFFSDLKNLIPNYPNVDQNINNAHFYGTDFVFVSINNQSGQVIPFRLVQELLNFNTYGLDDFWTVYHNRRENDITYNYGIDLNFKSLQISPERIAEREFRREKTIKDGWEYVLDRNGNVVKDSLGNDVKVDKYITVAATINYTEQTKAVAVAGNVLYKDLVRNRVTNSHPLITEFWFENVFARFRGDERALTREDLQYIRNDFFPFPSNPQMILDAGTEIKLRLKSILSSNSFR